MIAPCGMNCGVCKAHLREKNPCPGCRSLEKTAPKTRAGCKIRLCEKRKGEFCFSCGEFPCKLLVRLDDRYRKKYGMSQIENLNRIKENGINAFLNNENKKWVSSKGILCVHDKRYYPRDE